MHSNLKHTFILYENYTKLAPLLLTDTNPSTGTGTGTSTHALDDYVLFPRMETKWDLLHDDRSCQIHKDDACCHFSTRLDWNLLFGWPVVAKTINSFYSPSGWECVCALLRSPKTIHTHISTPQIGNISFFFGLVLGWGACYCHYENRFHGTNACAIRFWSCFLGAFRWLVDTLDIKHYWMSTSRPLPLPNIHLSVQNIAIFKAIIGAYSIVANNSPGYFKSLYLRSICAIVYDFFILFLENMKTGHFWMGKIRADIFWSIRVYWVITVFGA